jgi:hypothetical protein
MQIGIYVGNQTNLDNLADVIGLMKNDNEDIFMFTDDILIRPIPIIELACINMSHVIHYYKKIIFLDHEDFNTKSKELNGIIGVVCNKVDLPKLDKDLVKTKKASVIIKDKKGLREAKNAELH